MTRWQYKTVRCSIMDNKSSEAYDGFTKTIEDLLSDGWVLVGGVSSCFMTYRNSSGVLLVQALVKGEIDDL